MVVVLEMKSHTVVVHQGVNTMEALVPREIWVVPLIRVIGITIRYISWRLVLTHKIGLISKHLSYCRNGGTLLSHMLS